MVARTDVRARVEPMQLDDLPAVQAIERASFTTPWPPHAYRNELETNRLAHYRVVRVGDRIVAFGGLWMMVDEAHITTFAVDPAWRRRRLGELLLLALLDLAIEKGGREATLEVRLSNLPARRLYEKYGFRPVGLRPRYYSDNNEDALIMTTETLDAPQMEARLARLRTALEATLAAATFEGAPAGSAPPGSAPASPKAGGPVPAGGREAGQREATDRRRPRSAGEGRRPEGRS